MPDRFNLRRWAALVIGSALLAIGLSFAGFPGAFLLGPMLVAIALAVNGAPLALPKPAFQAAQALLGCLVAHAVTHDFLLTLRDNGAVIVLVVLLTVAAGALVGLILTRWRVLPGDAAAWGSAPGGAAAMVALAEAYGSDPRLVAFMQYVRVAAVVLSAAIVARMFVEADPVAAIVVEPFAAGPVLATLAVAVIGAVIAIALRLPAGALIGPMLLGSTLHAAGLVEMRLPEPLLALAYATIGCHVGLRFTSETLTACRQALPGVLAATLLVILLCGIGAYGLTFLLPVDFLTAFLATSPGGLDSVAIIAVGAKADVSFVLSVQTLRLLVVLATGPIIARWIAGFAEPAGS